MFQLVASVEYGCFVELDVVQQVYSLAHTGLQQEGRDIVTEVDQSSQGHWLFYWGERDSLLLYCLCQRH